MTCMCDALGKVALSAITLQARFPSLIHSSGEMAEGSEGGRSGQHFILTKGKAILETRTPKRRGAARTQDPLQPGLDNVPQNLLLFALEDGAGRSLIYIKMRFITSLILMSGHSPGAA